MTNLTITTLTSISCPNHPSGSQFSSVQLLSCVRLFETPWTAVHQVSLSITNSWSLLKLISIESVIPSSHLILCHPLLLPSIFPSIRVLSNESVLCIRWPKYWSFSFNISPSNEYSGLISFRMDQLDLLAVQGTLKSFLQHHSSKASIRWHSAFFIVQHSHPYVTTGKTIALTRWTFAGKVMSLLFNILSRFVITFLPGSKHLLISWSLNCSHHLQLFWESRLPKLSEQPSTGSRANSLCCDPTPAAGASLLSVQLHHPPASCHHYLPLLPACSDPRNQIPIKSSILDTIPFITHGLRLPNSGKREMT